MISRSSPADQTEMSEEFVRIRIFRIKNFEGLWKRKRQERVDAQILRVYVREQSRARSSEKIMWTRSAKSLSCWLGG